jgi:hypothetical protein
MKDENKKGPKGRKNPSGAFLGAPLGAPFSWFPPEALGLSQMLISDIFGFI